MKISNLLDKTWFSIVSATLNAQKKKYLALLLVCLIAVGVFTFTTTLFGHIKRTTKPNLHKEKRALMGTYVEVISPAPEAAKIVFAEIERIENLLSKYKQTSEIAQLNKAGSLAVSKDTAYILRKAKEFWLKSDGALDITVGPLLELWGFADKDYRVPNKSEIKKTLKLVGMEKIVFAKDDNMVAFRLSGMHIDLGALAKGYAIDCAVKKLMQHNIRSCLINAGGDIYCLGNKFGKPWEIALKDPRENDFIDYLKLEDKAVATSGDYAQYFIRKNERFTHIINPRTGSPVTSEIVSVTVIARDCLTADALATAIFVLGKQKGMDLAARFQDAKVKIIEQKDLTLP